MEKIKRNVEGFYQKGKYVGSSIPDKEGVMYELKYPTEGRAALTYRSYDITRKQYPPIELLRNGELITTSFFKCINIRPKKEVEQILNVLRKAEGISYELNEEFAILQENNDNESKKFACAITRKGISMLNTFEYLYDLEPKEKYRIVSEAVIIVNAFDMFLRKEFRNCVLVDITHLEKITNINNPNTISKIYRDIKPMVDKYFFSDLSLNNIYHDKFNDRYVIFGVSDFIEHSNSYEIMIDLDAFLNGDSLYRFKKTGEPVTFDEYLIYRYGFSQVKKEWEVL